jgi:MFS family permease
MSVSPLHWINTALIMATLVGILVAGTLSDAYGRKKVFIIGASGLVIFSVIAFFFPTQPSQLILRALGGLFSMLMIPLGITAVALSFDIKLRPQAFFLVFTASGLGILLRPIMEEFWVTLFGSGSAANLSTIIFGMWGLILIWRFMPESRAKTGSHRFGMMGIVLWSLAILSLIYAFITFLGGESKESSLRALLIGLAAFGGAWWWSAREVKTWRQKMEVLEDQAIMHDSRMKQLAFALIAGVVFYFAQGAFMYLLYNYIYAIREISSLQINLAYLPLALGALVMGIITARWLKDSPGYLMLTIAIALGGLSLIGLSILAPDTASWWIALMTFIFGAVLILVNLFRSLIVLFSVSENYYGYMSAINNVTGRLGYTFGMIASKIMLLTFSFTSIENQLLSSGVSHETINSIADTIKYSYLMENFNTTPELVTTIPDTMKLILSQSMGKTFLIIGIAQLITAVIVWFGLKPKGISFRGAVNQLKTDRID